MPYAPLNYRNLVTIQKLIMAKLDDSNPTARDLALLSRAMCELEETKRRLRMRPLPKPIDVASPLKQLRLVNSPREVSGSET